MTAPCPNSHRETERAALAAGEEARDRKSSAREAGADARHSSPGAVSPDRREPFRLYLRKGSDRYRVTFAISGVRYEGSTLCSELDLAAMVARAVYAEVRETAGRLSRDDVRRTARTVRNVRGTWLNLRPKRLPSTIAR